MLALESGQGLPEVDPAKLAALVALLVLWVAIWVWICRYLAEHLRVLPEEATRLKPWTPWLVLVPGVGLFFNFWVFLGIAYGYRKAFEDLGRKLTRQITCEHRDEVSCEHAALSSERAYLSIAW